MGRRSRSSTETPVHPPKRTRNRYNLRSTS